MMLGEIKQFIIERDLLSYLDKGMDVKAFILVLLLGDDILYYL